MVPFRIADWTRQRGPDELLDGIEGKLNLLTVLLAVQLALSLILLAITWRCE
jgi:hypothetical protein